MNLKDLCDRIGARILANGEKACAVDVKQVYAGDRISDILSECAGRKLLVTNLANAQVMRVVELVEVPAVCFVGNVDPDPQIVDAARALGTLLMTSPSSLFETCGRVYQCLIKEET